MAELSRVAYRPGSVDVLAGVGLRQVHEFDRRAARAVLVVHESGPGEPTAIVAFRGTHDPRNWLSNLNTIPVTWPRGGRVHGGFVEVLDRIWPEIDAWLASWPGRVVYTGHSLGAALATLAASRRPPTSVYSFGSPRVGDAAFADTLEPVAVHRVVNNLDIVPTVPPSVGPLEFVHVGELLHMRHGEAGPASAADVALDDPATCRRWFDPPQPLADHAPINYVEHVRVTSCPKDSSRR